MKYYANNELAELAIIRRPSNILRRQRVSTYYTVPLTGTIGEIHEYGDLVSILADANCDDQIYIQLSSPGGDLATCDYLCRRMEECEAHITIEIGLTCASAASAIALQADEWVIYDSSTMMIHSCSYSPGFGKESDIRSITEFTERLNGEWLERTYSGFLFEEEMAEAETYGKDIYLFSDDLRQRLPDFKKYRADCKAQKLEETLQYWEKQQAAA